jgi:hypothetical protein
MPLVLFAAIDTPFPVVQISIPLSDSFDFIESTTF